MQLTLSLWHRIKAIIVVPLAQAISPGLVSSKGRNLPMMLPHDKDVIVIG